MGFIYDGEAMIDRQVQAAAWPLEMSLITQPARPEMIFRGNVFT